MTSGPRLRRLVGCLRSVIGIEVHDTREGFWSQCREVLALLGC
jgi:hypothetical protein